MTTGLSLHLGLNAVDPDQYDGWDGALLACENDARDMAALAGAAGFAPTTLLTADGTSARLADALHDAAGRLRAGDVLLFTYSGHGGQLPDTAGPDVEPDALDETLVLHDRQFLDDEVQHAFRAFADDVRIVAVFDCCHSGSSIEIPDVQRDGPAGRYLPEHLARALADRDRDRYDDVRRALEKAAAEEGRRGTGPASLLVSACQDNQVALDGPVNGAFTGALLKVWDGGAFRGGYRAFHRAIQRRLPPTQSPNLYVTGSPSEEFLNQRPFTV
ncbi:caspase family protein [Streptomyces sp. NPDC003327]